MNNWTLMKLAAELCQHRQNVTRQALLEEQRFDNLWRDECETDPGEGMYVHELRNHVNYFDGAEALSDAYGQIVRATEPGTILDDEEEMFLLGVIDVGQCGYGYYTVLAGGEKWDPDRCECHQCWTSRGEANINS